MVGIGPISANAEEPFSTLPGGSTVRAYLRERGGTVIVNSYIGLFTGLSPRTRRNRETEGRFNGCSRPISANAEEPKADRPPARHHWAYLRERGGTRTGIHCKLCAEGLSPRTRRNLLFGSIFIGIPGPISANAEEPNRYLLIFWAKRAYLRERGGTAARAQTGICKAGLSPRTRRNLLLTPEPRGAVGPISANAEEPITQDTQSGLIRAYLRERGGTCFAGCYCLCIKGLSPRTRRNPCRSAAELVEFGPISANAEEPLRSNSLLRKRKLENPFKLLKSFSRLATTCNPHPVDLNQFSRWGSKVAESNTTNFIHITPDHH